MNLKNLNVSCWSNEGISVGSTDHVSLCPSCNGKTKEVKSITVKHFVLDNLLDKVNNSNYYICLSEDCDIVYYNTDYSSIFRKEHMKIPIWYKKDASPKYICYCNKVTEEDIINAVVNGGAKNIKDIVNLTGAMKNVNCEINNPFGKCCSPHIQETINMALKMK